MHSRYLFPYSQPPGRLFGIGLLHLLLKSVLCEPWTKITIKNVTLLGPQLTPDVTSVSRDGGYSVLVNGNIVWLYDDTECMGYAGNQLSFVSNTAAISSPNTNISTVTDFGVVMVSEDSYGRKEYAILANDTVGTGGWIPFQPDELQFNNRMKGQERVAIWPGTSPTPISISQAFIFAPLVYVDYQPQDPSKEYQARGMTLVTITVPGSGPVATRQGDLVIPGTQVAYGGFATILGFPSTAQITNDNQTRDVYLLGAANNGLQLARVCLDDVETYNKYMYFNRATLDFSTTAPNPNTSDPEQTYLPGTFTSGSVFYRNDAIWIEGGKSGNGIVQEDAEALVKYAWSPQQTLYASPPGKGGFNYAGTAHPEYFNRQYFSQSLYPDGTPSSQRTNLWYGSAILQETDASGDGRHLLLSWTSQMQGGTDNGIYQIRLAKVEFDSIQGVPQGTLTATTGTVSISAASVTSADTPQPSKTPENMIPSRARRKAPLFGSHERRDYASSPIYWGSVLIIGVLWGTATLLWR